jgi:hypothetical protein
MVILKVLAKPNGKYQTMSNKHKAKGTAFETLIKDYLVAKGFPDARRAVLAGENDTGDIHGIQQRITLRNACLQCKNQKKWDLSGWLNATIEQAKRLKNALPVLIVKRAGNGAKTVGESYVVMRLDDFVELLQDAQYQ